MFNKTIWPTASANTKVFVVVVYFVFVGIRSPLCQKDKEIFNIKITVIQPFITQSLKEHKLDQLWLRW